MNTPSDDPRNSHDRPEIAAAHAADAGSAARFHQVVDDALAAADPARVLAVLVVSLKRSDRLASVLGTPHAVAVTRQLHERIHAMLRANDRYVMVSAEEVWLLLPDLRSQALATLAANRLAAIIMPAVVHAEHSVYVRPCIGIACAPQNAQTAALLIQAADQAQQAARAENTVYAFSEACEQRGTLPDDLEGALKRVLASNALTVVYQPQVELATLRVHAVEALIRWPAVDPASVPTVLLVETAERAGLIGAVTMHVLNTLLRERSAWLLEGVDVKVWINLSARSLTEKDLPQMLLQALQIWSMAPSALGLEITESSLVKDIEQTTAVLQALRHAGFTISIDDFGTGYSSMAYLRRFPIAELKIDRMFVNSMATSTPDHQIVRSIIDLAHNFGLKVVAEGAEDAQTVAILAALGCDLVQGYVYAKPMPGAALVEWITAFHERHAQRG